MRIFEVGTVGAALAYLALSFSQSGSGYPQAAAFLASLLIAAVTIGVAISLGTHAWPEPPQAAFANRVHRCHGCGHRMRQVRNAWVCIRCDRAPAFRHLV